MEDLIRFILTRLVTRPEAIQVAEVEGRSRQVFQVRVAPEDAGLVIGRSGRTINAIRQVLNAAASKSGHRVWLDLLDEHERGLGEEGAQDDDEPLGDLGPGADEIVEEGPLSGDNLA